MKKDFIYINDLPVHVKDWNLNLLQLCEEVDITIPRFCYHDELSVAGNCRMCLIEVMNSPKPIISCGCMLTKEMRVYTDSTLVKKAREYVMEFLLINHPLDCPICDQGGECDLQDQSFVYGSDRGRFKEVKRAVEDIDLGPFIKTIMNRCIHCTRCIRFSTEVLNLNSLSMLGRGRESEIGTYTSQEYLHELSGNVIDLCPVGALTSKPYTFTARPWELFSMESVDVLNSFCSDIKVDVKGNEVMRILPVTDNCFKTEWITDSIRFCFDGLKKDRLVNPLIYDYKENYFFSCSWEMVYYFFKRFNISNYLIYLGDNLDIGSISIIDNWVGESPFSIRNMSDSHKKLSNVSDSLVDVNQLDLGEKDCLFFLNCNLKQEQPVLDSLIKKKESINSFFKIGGRVDTNYRVLHVGLTKKKYNTILKGKHFLSNKLCDLKNVFFFSNNIHEVDQVKNLTNKMTLPFCRKFCLVTHKSTHFNYNFFGNNTIEKKKYEKSISNKSSVNLILNSDQEIFYSSKNVTSFNLYIGHHMNNNSVDCNFVLPCKVFLEEEGSFYNISGEIKKTTIVLDHLDLSKSMKDILYLISGVKQENIVKNPLVYRKTKGLFFDSNRKDFGFYYVVNQMMPLKNITSYSNNVITKKSISLLKAEYEKKKKKYYGYNF